MHHAKRNGVIERRIVSTRQVAVEYAITARHDAAPPVDVLLAWAAEHMPAIERARDALDGAGQGLDTPLA
ncbi:MULTISPECIES: winged helix-turn-helix transcriptional regulator [Mumia]|uniref:winged helix-turn-helix transcriptional regulator n=1 Tax=Mumia TaxID=1546255 RepID=UPI001AB0497B|nr:helix-turn-helix transcriptional regulator [Mumia sp. ZJ430]